MSKLVDFTFAPVYNMTATVVLPDDLDPESDEAYDIYREHITSLSKQELLDKFLNAYECGAFVDKVIVVQEK